MENQPEIQSIVSPARQIPLTFNVLSVQFVRDIKFPLTGQMIDIETLKTSLARNEYSNIAMSPFGDANAARLYIDMIATFTVLLPELLKDLTVRSFQELELIVARKILKDVYMKQYLPWYNSWIKAFNDLDELEDKTLTDELNLAKSEQKS